MKKFSIYCLSSVLSVLLVLTGCGSSDVAPTTFISASPAPDSTIFTDTTLTLTFDNMPENVTVSQGSAVPSGNTVVIQGPFSFGTLSLVVMWDDDSVTLSYTVESPAVAFSDAALRTVVEDALGVVGLFSFIDIHFIKLTVSKGFDAYSFILSAIRVMP